MEYIIYVVVWIILIFADDAWEVDIEGDTSFTNNSAPVSGCATSRLKLPRNVCTKFKGQPKKNGAMSLCG